jgi:hypothetical protein
MSMHNNPQPQQAPVARGPIGRGPMGGGPGGPMMRGGEKARDFKGLSRNY